MEFATLIPAMIAKAAAFVAPLTTSGAAATAGGTAAGIGAAGVGGVAGSGIGLGVGGATTAGALGTASGLGVGGAAATPGLSVAAGAAGAASAAAPALPSLGTMLGGAALAGGAGLQAYQGMQQASMLKQEAKAEQRQVSAQQMEYQNKLRQVLSMNMADAAARGVTPGGSLSAAQQSVLEGGQIAMGNMQSDLNRKLALYNAARRNALITGFGQAGMTGLYAGGVLSGGRIG